MAEMLTMRVDLPGGGAVGIPSDWIDVRVEDDDGYVSYAELESREGTPNPVRCWVNTGTRSPTWEVGNGDGDWNTVESSEVDLADSTRTAMARAARAGLVAIGR
jgi:hypothetical protein